MKMFEVTYQTHFANVIDVGHVVLCAENEPLAIDIVLDLCELPRSATQFKVRHVAPGLLVISQKQIGKDLQARPRKATIRDDEVRRQNPDTILKKYMYHASAQVEAPNEGVALRWVADELMRRAQCLSMVNVNRRVKNVSVACNTILDQRAILRNSA